MSDTQKTSAYQSTSYTQTPQSGNPTYTEAWALVEAARRMAVAIQHSDCADKSQKSPVRDALRLNWRLWTIFQTELSLSEEGPVPPDIRQNMLNLCNFIDKQTVDAIANPTPEKVSTLIEINRNIANGLLESINDGATQDQAETDEQEPQQPMSINENV